MTAERDGDGAGRGAPWRALVGLVAIVAPIAGLLFIVDRLRQAARVQDCFASGRTNCAPIEGTGRRLLERSDLAAAQCKLQKFARHVSTE